MGKRAGRTGVKRGRSELERRKRSRREELGRLEVKRERGELGRSDREGERTVNRERGKRGREGERRSSQNLATPRSFTPHKAHFRCTSRGLFPSFGACRGWESLWRFGRDSLRYAFCVFAVIIIS